MNYFKVYRVVLSHDFSDGKLILATFPPYVRRENLEMYGLLASKMLLSESIGG